MTVLPSGLNAAVMSPSCSSGSPRGLYVAVSQSRTGPLPCLPKAVLPSRVRASRVSPSGAPSGRPARGGSGTCCGPAVVPARGANPRRVARRVAGTQVVLFIVGSPCCGGRSASASLEVKDLEREESGVLLLSYQESRPEAKPIGERDEEPDHGLAVIRNALRVTLTPQQHLVGGPSRRGAVLFAEAALDLLAQGFRRLAPVAIHG